MTSWGTGIIPIEKVLNYKTRRRSSRLFGDRILAALAVMPNLTNPGVSRFRFLFNLLKNFRRGVINTAYGTFLHMQNAFAISKPYSKLESEPK